MGPGNTAFTFALAVEPWPDHRTCVVVPLMCWMPSVLFMLSSDVPIREPSVLSLCLAQCIRHASLYQVLCSYCNNLVGQPCAWCELPYHILAIARSQLDLHGGVLDMLR